MSHKYIKISKEDTYALIKSAQQGDFQAKETIVNQNTGLVKSIALKFTNSGYEFEDLVQIGYIGLLKAIEKFDMGFDVMFSTYAVPMILGEIKRHLRDDGKIKVSRQLKLEIRNFNNYNEEFFNKFGRWPKVSEIAEYLESSPEHVLEILEAKDVLSSIESLDNPERVETNQYVNKENYFESEENTVDVIYLKTVIGSLGERERQVIVLRYFRDMTQQQVARVIGISQVQVSRIEKKVISSIRKEMTEVS